MEALVLTVFYYQYWNRFVVFLFAVDIGSRSQIVTGRQKTAIAATAMVAKNWGLILTENVDRALHCDAQAGCQTSHLAYREICAAGSSPPYAI